MIYSIKLIIEIDNNYIKNNYYSILGSVLNIIGDNKQLKDSILSISNIHKSNDDNFSISISIIGKDSFNNIINIIQNKKEININGKIFNILGLDFNFSIFDNDTIIYNDYKKIEISFKSPTIIKKEINGIDINQLLPIPEVFLLSSIRKYSKIYGYTIDFDLIKKAIKNNVIVVSFDISTKLVRVKGNNKAGLVGKVKYEIFDSIDRDTKILLYNALNLSKLLGIGTGNRLGLGQVGVYFSK
ncbi:MAG: CRISPR system precrRNA processing endoribonuclease RAMP protein Cas6 [Candidatus Gracilibacteria bacterium]|nr:CRISPR system precrRNA processing endoribonuclease RAMP protein Cas6 [Candidatus Gracilibacteria bacterium]